MALYIVTISDREEEMLDGYPLLEFQVEAESDTEARRKFFTEVVKLEFIPLTNHERTSHESAD